MLTPWQGPIRRIGPYRIIGRIGAGGMGEVFLARREVAGGVVAGPLVAVKTVKAPADGTDPDVNFRIRFRREIQAPRAVTGPYTAALLDGDAQIPWLATEYVAGPALGEAVARCGPLPVPAVRRLGAGLAQALDAHDAERVDGLSRRTRHLRVLGRAAYAREGTATVGPSTVAARHVGEQGRCVSTTPQPEATGRTSGESAPARAEPLVIRRRWWRRHNTS